MKLILENTEEILMYFNLMKQKTRKTKGKRKVGRPKKVRRGRPRKN